MAKVTVLTAVGTDMSSATQFVVPDRVRADVFTFLVDTFYYAFVMVLRVLTLIARIFVKIVTFVDSLIDTLRFWFFARNKKNRFLALNLAILNILIVIGGFMAIRGLYFGAQTLDYLVNVRHPPLSVAEVNTFMSPIYQTDLFIAAYAPKKVKAVTAQIPYFVYRVQPGDSLYTIALKYGISVNTIIAANNIKNANYLKIGQILKIPTRDGILYKVKNKTETLASIAKKYKKDVKLLAKVNNVKENAVLKQGTLVLIPGKPPTVKIKTKTTGGGTYLNGSYFTNIGGSCSFAIKFTGYGIQTTIVKPQVRYVSFIRYNPVAGSFGITSRFAGYRYKGYLHAGIDYSAAEGTPIIAVADGVVSRVEDPKKKLWGYGIFVKIYHPKVGLYTLYAHMLRRAPGVTIGTRVKAGQVIGYVGQSGWATGPHVHFEVIDRNRIRYNPVCFR